MRRGNILLLATIYLSITLTLAVFLGKIIYNELSVGRSLAEKSQAFWLAEAGLAAARQKDPGWFTDLPHYPEDNLNWLKSGAVGSTVLLGRGSFKLVKEERSDRVYSIGRVGRAVAVLKEKGSVWLEL